MTLLLSPKATIEVQKRVQQKLLQKKLQAVQKERNVLLKQSVARQKVLNQVIRRIRRSLALDDIIFRSTAKEVHRALDCDRVVIYRFNEDWSVYFVAEALSPSWQSLIPSDDNDVPKNTSGVNDDSCVVQLFDRSQQTTLEDSYFQDSQGGIYIEGIPYRAVDDIYNAGFPPCYLKLLESFEAKAYVILPIFQGDRLWGLVGVYQNSGPRHWQVEETEMLVQITGQLGIALQQSALLMEVREAKEKAEKASQAKGLFLANMSHELRTPLNCILGFSEFLMGDDSLNEDQLDSLDSIYVSGQHLLKLINNVLSMSKIEAGMVELYPEDFELAVCLQSVKDIVAIAAEKKYVELRLEVSDKVPKKIFGDEGKLKQILINLVNNAIKFTELGSVTIQVSSLAQLATTHKVRFEVIDTGVGMTEAEIALLFQAFQQTESGRQSKQGTGLGLAISQSFVQLMGGQIQVESRKGEGSRFWFDLKLNVLPNDAEALPEAEQGQEKFPEKAIAANPEEQEPPKVLVVENDSGKGTLALLNGQLDEFGFETMVVQDDRLGQELWQGWQPDLIVLDIRIPSVQNSGILSKIQEMTAANPGYKRPKIILVTADVFYNQNEAKESFDCDEMLYKPLESDQLIRAIAKHIDLSCLIKA